MDKTRLREIPLFADLDDQDLDVIAAFAEEKSAGSGQVLVREGDFSDALIAIEEGTADVEKHGERIAALGPGDFFGEVGMVSSEMRGATVRASSAMRYLTLTTFDFKRVRKLPGVQERIDRTIDARVGTESGRSESSTRRRSSSERLCGVALNRFDFLAGRRKSALQQAVPAGSRSGPGGTNMRIKLGLAGAAIASVMMGTSAHAAPADLDPAFGAGGVATAAAGRTDALGAPVVQPSGKVVVAGVDSGGRIVLERFTATGALDSWFGTARRGGHGSLADLQPCRNRRRRRGRLPRRHRVREHRPPDPRALHGRRRQDREGRRHRGRRPGVADRGRRASRRLHLRRRQVRLLGHLLLRRREVQGLGPRPDLHEQGLRDDQARQLLPAHRPRRY